MKKNSSLENISKNVPDSNISDSEIFGDDMRFPLPEEIPYEMPIYEKTTIQGIIRDNMEYILYSPQMLPVLAHIPTNNMTKYMLAVSIEAQRLILGMLEYKKCLNELMPPQLQPFIDLTAPESEVTRKKYVRKTVPKNNTLIDYTI